MTRPKIVDLQAAEEVTGTDHSLRAESVFFVLSRRRWRGDTLDDFFGEFLGGGQLFVNRALGEFIKFGIAHQQPAELTFVAGRLKLIKFLLAGIAVIQVLAKMVNFGLGFNLSVEKGFERRVVGAVWHLIVNVRGADRESSE